MVVMKTFLTATILCGGVLLAADFWQTKKPSEWTEKEARKLIEGSPWVKETTPKMTDAGMSSRGEGGGGRGGGGRSGGGGGGMGAGGGGMGAGGGGGDMGGGGGGGPMSGPAGGQMPQVRVTFETAMPVAEAKGRIEIQDGFKGVREEYVVISVSGMRMMGGMGSRSGAQSMRPTSGSYSPTDGRALDATNWIYPGWKLAVPKSPTPATPSLAVRWATPARCPIPQAASRSATR